MLNILVAIQNRAMLFTLVDWCSYHVLSRINDNVIYRSYILKYYEVCNKPTVVPTKSDSDVLLCLPLLNKKIACTLHLI